MGPLPLLLLLLAVPEAPQAALAELDRFGAVPECHLEESIEGEASNHRHRFSPPRVLPALEGKAAVLLPYLEHPSRAVVLRAAALLCHAGGDEAHARLHALAAEYPCERELMRVAVALTQDEQLGQVASRSAAACPEPPAAPLLAPARTLSRWPADAAAAKAIGAGDAAALSRALWSLDALDPAVARRAAATLARVDTPRGVLATLRGVFQLLGAEAPGKTEPLVKGILGAQLDALAAASKSSQLAAYCRVVGAGAVEDYPMLRALSSRLAQTEPGLLEKEAEQARRAEVPTAFGRAYLEALARPQHDWMQGLRRLELLVAHRDRPALRALVNDAANGIVQRLEAAKALAVLGDASGLSLWDSSEGLWPEERAERRALLASAGNEAPAVVRAQIEALLAKRWTP